MAQAPKGYTNQSTDVVGMWDPELSEAIHLIPTGVKLFDSNMDKNKPSCLIIGKLVDPCKLTKKEDGEDVEVDGKSHDIVGVWYKPGMKAILRHAGHKVWMTPAGEKNIGKPSPMKLFAVMSPDAANATLLPVLEDTRDRSLGVRTSFDKRSVSAPNQSDDGEDDNIPF